MVPSYGLLQVQEDRIPSFRGVGKNVDSRPDYSGFQDGLVDWLWDLLGIAEGLRRDCGGIAEGLRRDCGGIADEKKSRGEGRPRRQKVLLRMPDGSTTTSERALKPPKKVGKPLLVVMSCVPSKACTGIDESVLGAKEHRSLLVSLRRWLWVLDSVDTVDWIDWVDSGPC